MGKISAKSFCGSTLHQIHHSTHQRGYMGPINGNSHDFELETQIG